MESPPADPWTGGSDPWRQGGGYGSWGSWGRWSSGAARDAPQEPAPGLTGGVAAGPTQPGAPGDGQSGAGLPAAQAGPAQQASAGGWQAGTWSSWGQPAGGGGSWWSSGASSWGDRTQYEYGLQVDMAKWNFREWPKLDLDKPSSFSPWFNHFRWWVKDDRECVERLFKLLEREVEPIDLAREDSFKVAANLPAHWERPSRLQGTGRRDDPHRDG